LGANGWYTSAVSVTWTTADPESGITTTTPGCAPANLTQNTAGMTITCTATNGAGLTASNSVVFKIDTTAPVITPTLTGTAVNGYYKTASLTWAVADPESGIATSSGCSPVASVVAGQSYTCTATNGAGTSASITISPMIDTTPPVIVPTLTGVSGNNGWYRSLNVSWSVTDPETGISSSNGCSPAAVPEPGATLTCSATNGVGLTASNSVTAKVDATAPTITVVAPGTSALLLNAVVNASYSCADATSGVATCTGSVANGSPLDTSTPGPKSFTVTATDVAGNSVTKTVNYSVGYTFTGFASPLSAAGTFSGSSGLGKALPIKWTLQNAGGTYISDLSAIGTITAIFTGPATGGVCPVQTTPALTTYTLYLPVSGGTGSTVLRFSSPGFIFNWDTSSVGATGAGCYTITVQTADNAQYSTSVLLQ
jgi:hypothetical protein